MENQMGRVVVTAKIENIVELYNADAGLIPADKVHRLEVRDALVDTGSSYLAMPRRLIEQLGFQKPSGSANSRTTQGDVLSNIYGPVRLTIQDRFCSVDIAEIQNPNYPVLIGQIPLEILDFVVDSKNQRLIGNPEHGGQQMLEMYGMIFNDP